jgi:hypothetical protein
MLNHPTINLHPSIEKFWISIMETTTHPHNLTLHSTSSKQLLVLATVCIKCHPRCPHRGCPHKCPLNNPLRTLSTDGGSRKNKKTSQSRYKNRGPALVRKIVTIAAITNVEVEVEIGNLVGGEVGVVTGVEAGNPADLDQLPEIEVNAIRRAHSHL